MAPWQELSRTELEEMILAALTRQWITPKQLAPLIGVPWRVLMRALPRLQMCGKVEGRLEQVVVERCRKRPRRWYRLPAAVGLAMCETLEPPIDVTRFKVLGVVTHRCLEDEPDEQKEVVGLKLGYRW